MNSLSPEVSRFVAVSLLLLLVLSLVFYVIVPLTNGYSERAGDIAMLEKRLSTLRGLLANEVLVDTELKSLESINTSGDIFLKGDKAAIASANLREFVGNIVKQSGGVLISSQDYETASLDIASAVGLRLSFNGEMQHLAALLYELESSRPLVFIDKLTVTSSANQRGAATRAKRRRAARSSRAPRMSLTVRMDIFGYMVAGDS